MFEDDSIIITSEGQVGTEKITRMSKLVERARQQIMEQEDTEIFKVLDAIAAAESK
jgi:hypothetical protein